MKKASIFPICALGAMVIAAMPACSGGSRFAPAGAAQASRGGDLTLLSRMRDVALTMPYFRNFPVHTDHRKHFMRAVSKKAALLYVGDWATNNVYVYDYPSGKSVGSIGSFDEPYGMCVNDKHDVFVSNYGNGDLDEIAPGGKTIVTYSTGGSEAIGCSVSPKGDVAVTSFDPGEVTVFAGGDPSKGTTYTGSCTYLWPMGYDRSGNLIGVGETSSGGRAYCGLLSGAKSMSSLSFSGTIDFPGGTTWDGKYIALGDQEAGGTFQTGVWRATISGSTITAIGSEVVFSDSCYNDYADDVNPFFAGITPKSKVQATTMVGPNLWCTDAGTGKVDYWNYPAGGTPSGNLASAPAEPYGAAVTGAAPTASPPPAKRKVVLSFAGGSSGETPNTKLISDSSGDLFGTTESGGTSNDGTVFELVKTGKKYSETVLHSFGGSDGVNPEGTLLLNASGVIYGTTAQGGSASCGCGVIFSLTPKSGGYTYAVLYQFAGGSDGANPMAGLINLSNGTMYGTTEYGGNLSCATSGCGTIFQYDTTHGYAQDAQLNSSVGVFPVAPLTAIVCGSSCSLTGLVGVGTQGGSGSCTGGGCGTIFEADKVGSSWVVSLAYSFGSQNGDGSDPQSPLTQVAEYPPAFVGATRTGGGSCNCGTIYYTRRPSTGTWAETVLHQFVSGTGDGQYPVGNLVVDSSQAVLGNTYAGGTTGVGTAFGVTYTGSGSSPQEGVIYNYSSATGSMPLAGFAVAGSGSDAHGAKVTTDRLFVTASAGSKYGFGSGMVIIHEQGGGVLKLDSPRR